MRICFITTGDMRANASIRRALGMATPLIMRGHAVALAAWETPENQAGIAAACAAADQIRVPPGETAWLERRRKDRLVTAWRPDVIYLCGVSPRNLLPCDGRWLTGHPPAGATCRVVAEHAEWISPDCTRGFRYLMARVCNWRSQRAADGLVCASRCLERHYRQVCGPAKPVLYLPYAFTPQGVAALSDSIRPADGMKRIVYLGAMVREYGLFDLIAGAANLMRRRADFTLDLLGAGADLQAASEQVLALGLAARIRFHGYVDDGDLPGWLASSAVFAAPLNDTRKDRARCPSKLYSYIPYAKPVVTCRLGEAAALLGDDGFYYQPGDVNDLARALDAALTASGAWRPRAVTSAAHTWDVRAQTFERWLHQDLVP